MYYTELYNIFTQLKSPQLQIAEMFGTQRPAITKHLNNIYTSQNNVPLGI